MGDQHNALALLDNIIALLQKQAAYSEALKYAQQSFQIKAGGAAEIDLARSLMTVATLYLNLGLPDLAARYLTQATRIARKCQHHELMGWIQITYGYLYKDLGRMMESLNAFEEAIAIGESNQESSSIRWGCYGAVDLLVENGELEEASPYLHRLGPLNQKGSDPEFILRHAILLNRIEVVKQPHPDQTIGEKLTELISSCDDEGWSELQWEAEYFLGIFHHKRDEIEQAIEHLRKAHNIIQQLSAGLAEEYRQNFIKQRSRARVTADLKSLLPNAKTNSRTATSGETIGRGQATAALPSIQQTKGEEPPLTGATLVTGADRHGVADTTDETVNDTLIKTPGKLPAIIFDPKKSLEEYERDILRMTMEHYHNDRAQVAAALGISAEELVQKTSRHQL